MKKIDQDIKNLEGNVKEMETARTNHETAINNLQEVVTMENEKVITWRVIQFKDGKQQVIWEGKATSMQLRNYDNTIGKPEFISYGASTNTISVSFNYPNNIQIVAEKEDGCDDITLWCYPASTPEQLEQIKVKNAREEVMQS